jgi:anthranilate synthase/aminodeoxychorismate synthase-like glutamine amidotransferase
VTRAATKKPSAAARILLIDNYDSFTFNLVQRFGELGAACEVVRNDAADVASLKRLRPARVVISPGPCTPNEAGVSLEAIRAFAGEVPVLGVCLGHQAIGQAFGGKVVRAPEPVHGKTSLVEHDGSGLFSGISQPFVAGRYHSLVVARRALPKALVACAWTKDGTIMALRHATLPVFGLQFHPESILTPQGSELLRAFLAV